MLNQYLTRLPSKEEGATAVEYGLIAGLIAVVIVGALILIGPQLDSVFTSISTALGNAAN
ncbi:pilus assembly protein Flp/PilA [Hydrocarboniphaga daqingensis]|jgi:pilus assembly protein Flp/PilA|uniref:Pilus assembly protein Flp/PilA n=1 Tax=Hydrocarboniphaga daqingensis TaxID=490188 RepID=A0A1M5NSX1_9GAMM|nr:Flp family type IVb pilin [Hydrocarboniphaga daqingensis]SHG92714.1 pilus assembly protein Flp/PilA [Hydrocarboniphaga daqingensis]